MILHIDEKPIQLNISKMADKIYELYDGYKDKMIELPTGGTIDFRKKSVMRIAVKSALVPVLLPMIRGLYEAKNIPLEKPVKHSDLIDYSVRAILNLLKLSEGETNVYITTSQSDISTSRHVTAISTNGTITINSPTTRDTEKDED